MNDLEFPEENDYKRSSYINGSSTQKESVSKFATFLINKGIVKNTKGANIFMLVLAVIILILAVVIFVLFVSGGSHHVIMNPNFVK